MAYAYKRHGFVTVKMIAETTRTKPTAPATHVVTTNSLAVMGFVFPRVTYAMGKKTVWTAQMKTRRCVAEHRPPLVQGVLSVVAMGLACL